MKEYVVVLSDGAEAELDGIIFRLLGQSPEWAERWRIGLEKALASLQQFLRRCKTVAENPESGKEIRELLYGRRPSASSLALQEVEPGVFEIVAE